MAIDDTLLYLGGFSTVLTIIIIYIIMKDSEQSKKMRYLEHSIDKLHNQLYSAEEKLKEIKSKLDEAVQTNTTQYSNDEIQALIKQEVKEILEPIGETLSQAELSMKEFQESIQKKFETVESSVKQTMMIPQTSKSDEEKIVSMYKAGYSVDEIAKQFRIGAGEVELIIRFADLNA